MILVVSLATILAASPSTPTDEGSLDVWHHRVVPAVLAIEGLGIAGFWIAQVAEGKFNQGFFSARENGLLFWPHVFAEVGTAALLATAATSLFMQQEWAYPIAFLSLGALGYTSLNHLNWSLAEPDREPAAISMSASLALALASAAILF